MSTKNKISKSDLYVIYDKECPICNHFACAIKQSNQNIVVVNGREKSALLEKAREQGMDIDKGSIVYYNNEYHYGYKAFWLVAKITESKGLVGIFNKYFFRQYYIAKFSYPLLVLTRRLLLNILGKPLIKEKASE